MTPAPNAIVIDVMNDLKDASHLKTLITGNQKPIFAIASELAAFAGQRIGSAVGANPAKVTIQVPGQWKTSTGIGFSLSADASCAVTISNVSTKFSVAKSIDSKDTEDKCVGPVAGEVYINIDLDFCVQGNVTGSGNIGTVGISGKATGSTTTTLSYCHPIDANTEMLAAMKEAFSCLVLPFEPDCALVMPDNSICRVNFDASLGFELDASYGLASYKFSAPGIDTAKRSLQVGVESFTLPSVEIDVGAKASFAYTHCDHFGLIVKRTSPQSAELDLVRSAQNESDESIGITVGISSPNNLSASIDKEKLGQAVESVTKVNGSGTKVAAVADQIQSSLVSKANSWLSSQKTDAGLLVALSQQTNRAMLYDFSVDLTKADLTKQSWTQLASGDLMQAVGIGGMTLLPGSGVGNELKQSVCIGLHFFNLFKASDTSTYFRDSYVEVGPDGNVRFLYDIGNEDEKDTKEAMHKCRFHFVATANPGPNNTVQNADVDLYVELSESNNPGEAQKIAAAIGSLKAVVKDAQNSMIQFVNSNRKGTLNLVSVLKPAAYQRLACSQYTGGKPPANPQVQDSRNFAVFQSSCASLLHWVWLTGLSYPDWVEFNKYCNGAIDVVSGVPNPSLPPDRRAPGNPTAVPDRFFTNRHAYRDNITYYYKNCAGFMNLCDNLHSLAGLVTQLDVDKTLREWDDLLRTLTELAKNKLDADLTKPSVSALLQLSSGAAITTNLQPSNDNSCFTCTVTLS